MRSISDIVINAKERYPNIALVSDATIASTITDIEFDLYQFMGVETSQNITVTENNAAKDLGAYFRSDNLIRVVYFDQTGTPGGSADPDVEYQTIEDIESLKLEHFPQYLKLPLNDATHNVATVTYRAIPTPVSTNADDWDSTYACIDDEYMQVIVYKLIKQIAMFGDSPDIAISNNYEKEALQKIAKARTDYYARKRRNKKDRIDYKDYM